MQAKALFVIGADAPDTPLPVHAMPVDQSHLP
jgi:hypothetical protein